MKKTEEFSGNEPEEASKGSILSRRDLLASGLGFLTAQSLEAQGSFGGVRFTREQAVEAANFTNNEIIPIISRHIADPKEIQQVKAYLESFFQKIQQKKIGVEALPLLNPMGQDTFAQMQYDKNSRISKLYLYVPKLKADKLTFDRSFNSKGFEGEIVITICHEMIHLHLTDTNPVYKQQDEQGWPDKKISTRNEAETWGLFILKVIRPMIVAKRTVPKEIVILSNKLTELRDNYYNPDWIRQFDNYNK